MYTAAASKLCREAAKRMAQSILTPAEAERGGGVGGEHQQVAPPLAARIAKVSRSMACTLAILITTYSH